MEGIINLLAITSIVIITYYLTIYYDLKNRTKCTTMYKLRE